MISCTHLDHIRRVTPRTPEGCEECLNWAMYGATFVCAWNADTWVVAILQEQACKKALSPHRSPDRPVIRAGRELGLWMRLNWTLRDLPGYERVQLALRKPKENGAKGMVATVRQAWTQRGNSRVTPNCIWGLSPRQSGRPAAE